LLAIAAALGGYFALSGGDSGTTAQASDFKIGKGLAVANISGTNASSDQSAELAASGSIPRAAPGSSGGAAAFGAIVAPGRDAVSYPGQATTSNTGITVQGYGSATADADSAVVEFSFGSSGAGTPVPLPIEPDGSIRPNETTGTAEAITEADLQPVIDALTGAGVARDDIEFLDHGYYDPYYSSATLRATINNIDIVDGAVQAAQDAANSVGDIYLNGTSVSYTLQDCSALERAAMQAAVEDAHDRAVILAEVLGVTLGSVSGASDYSYSPWGSPCSGGFFGPYPMGGMPYKLGGTGEGTVQVVSNISVTYAFQ
jgi:uncharacterized protein YggE